MHIVPPQDRPFADTVPLPVPDLETVRVYWLVVPVVAHAELLWIDSFPAAS